MLTRPETVLGEPQRGLVSIMASTEPRAGFRPPWALNVDSDESTDAAPVTGTAEGTAEDPAPAESSVSEAAAGSSSGTSTPTKFQVDLARAMRAAAETARQESIERLAAESKVRVEAIRASSADAATELRQRADDDIAEIRDWSKGELARIRTETDAKISDRKSWLATEIEAHEESIEVLVSAVTSRVSAFEAELEAFFGRLAAEEDPTRIAMLAQALPDVPSLDDDAVIEAAGSAADAVATSAIETSAPTAADDLSASDDPVDAEVTSGMSDPVVEATSQFEETGQLEAEATAEGTSESTIETEASGSTDPWADAPGWGRPVGSTPDVTDHADASEPFAAVERRLAAFGLEAGSAEPAAAVEPTTDVVAGEEIGVTEGAAEVVTEAQAAHDAVAVSDPVSFDLVAEAFVSDEAAAVTESSADAAAAPTETSVVVDGLISVASIAGFKRSLSRFDGVHSVTVSSGPDGEFIFAVRHDATTALETALPTMPGYGARVTASEAGQISVSAHDAENTSGDVVLDPAGRRT